MSLRKIEHRSKKTGGNRTNVEGKLNPRADKFRRSELPEKYMAKLLFGQDNKKFEKEYLKKLEINWDRWKNKDRKISKIIWRNKETSFSGSRTLKRR